MLPSHNTNLVLYAFLIVTPFLLIKSTNGQLTPLQWKFQELPTTCSFTDVCVQAMLINSRTLMFDGKTRATWIFDWTKNTNGTWTQVITVNSPPGLQMYAMDSTSGGENVILFGGSNLDNTLSFNETWIFNSRMNDWTHLIVKSSPSARGLHAMASLGDSDKVLLFGGQDNIGNVLKDTWTFDQNTFKWTKVDVTSTSPPARYFHAMTSLGESDEVLLFGGTDGADDFDDTWVFNPSTRKWTKNTKSISSPSARSEHEMASLGIDGNVILFGGYIASGAVNSETWMYDEKTSQWTQVNDGSTKSSPSGGVFPAMASLGVDGKIVLFGGSDANAVNLVGTWIYNQNIQDWTKSNATATIYSPEGRAKHAMASLGESKVLLFGGFDVNNYFALGTWIFNPKTSFWIQVKTSSSPSGRELFAMASRMLDCLRK